MVIITQTQCYVFCSCTYHFIDRNIQTACLHVHFVYSVLGKFKSKLIGAGFWADLGNCSSNMRFFLWTLKQKLTQRGTRQCIHLVVVHCTTTSVLTNWLTNIALYRGSALPKIHYSNYTNLVWLYPTLGHQSQCCMIT